MRLLAGSRGWVVLGGGFLVACSAGGGGGFVGDGGACSASGGASGGLGAGGSFGGASGGVGTGGTSGAFGSGGVSQGGNVGTSGGGGALPGSGGAESDAPCRSSAECGSGKFCLGSKCVPDCTPSARFCWGENVMQCDATGRAATMVDDCVYDSAKCDPTTGACHSGLACSPGTILCDPTNSYQLSKCNEAGQLAAYESCDFDAGERCARDHCSLCKSASVAAQVRMKEVFLGLPGYVVLENTGDCTVDLNGSFLSFHAKDTYSSPGFEYALPTYRLGGGKIAIIGDGTVPWGGTFAAETEQAMPFGLGRGAYVLLCHGPCTVPSNVIDAFAYQGATSAGAMPPPPFPVAVTFTPLTAITRDTADDDSYVRVAYTGANPTFLASEWRAAPTTYGACVEKRLHGATSGGGCTTIGSACHLGAVTCDCLSDPLATYGTWSCQ